MKYIKSKERHRFDLINEGLFKNLFDFAKKIYQNIEGGKEITKIEEDAKISIDGLFKKQLDTILSKKAAQNNKEDKTTQKQTTQQQTTPNTNQGEQQQNKQV